MAGFISEETAASCAAAAAQAAADADAAAAAKAAAAAQAAADAEAAAAAKAAAAAQAAVAKAAADADAAAAAAAAAEAKAAAKAERAARKAAALAQADAKRQSALNCVWTVSDNCGTIFHGVFPPLSVEGLRDCSIAIVFLLTAQQMGAPSMPALLADVLGRTAYLRLPPFPWIKPPCESNSAF